MEEVKLNLDEKGHGAFYITNGTEEIGEMIVEIRGDDLTVYHTEVSPEEEGKGLAKLMLTTMVDYARNHHLSVIPLCPYVHSQFKRHPEEYMDVWKKDKVQE
jgi:predicted GNAT family acetyltransferase